jgi:cytochrome c oxidase subunit 2
MHLGSLASVPPTTSTFDFLYNWYLFFGTAAAVVVIGMLVFFMVRYRYKGAESPPIHHKTEGWKVVLVTVLITLSILTASEYQTFASFGNIQIPNSKDAVHIGVVGFQWGWNFTYPNGKSAVTTLGQPLTVPAGRVVILNLTSRDVFHSFGITMFGQKEDAIPG